MTSPLSGATLGLLEGADFAAVFEFESDGSDEQGVVTLTEVNSPTYAAAVRGNGAQLASASSQYFSLAAASAGDFDPGAESFVFASKVKWDAANTLQGITGRWRIAAPSRGWGMHMRGQVDSAIAWFIQDSAGTLVGVPATAGLAQADGESHSIVGVVDRAARLILLYYDAVLVGQSDISSVGDISGATDDLWIGGRALLGSGSTLDGLIDQVVFVRGRVWSLQDVLTYHGAAPGYPPNPVDILNTTSGGVAIQSARLGMFRLGLARLGAVLTPDELTADDSYIWSEYTEDIDTTPDWTEVDL